MPWIGVKTRMVIDTGDLRLEAGADEGSYILQGSLGNPYEDLVTLGRYRINCQFNAKESGGVIADDTNEIEVNLEIDTAVAAGPTWLGWQPYKPGEYYCRWYRIRVTVKADAAYGNRPRILRFEHSSTPIGSVPVASSIDDIIVTPTGVELLGTRYLVATGGTGVFLNKDDQMAELLDTTDRVWEFSLPTEGQKVYNISDTWVYEYEGGDYPAGSWVPRGLNVTNPEKDKFVGAVTVVGAKDQQWDTDGGGDIGLIGGKRPDEIHALSRITINGVDVISGGSPSPHLLGGSHHSADSLANLNNKVTGGSLDFTTDPRDPNAHAPDHENGGGDEIDVGGLSGQLADDQPALAHLLGGAKHTADSLANLNSKVTGGDLDFDSDSRPGACPIGGIIAWHKTFPNTPALPAQFVECNGQVLSDAGSPYNGQTIPDLNGDARFLRGSSTSGTNEAEGTKAPTIPFEESPGPWTMDNAVGGAVRRNIAYTLQGVGGNEVSFGGGGDAETRPINMSVVWIMRIK